MNAKKSDSAAVIGCRVLRVILVFAAAYFLIFQYQHFFTVQRWLGNPNQRSAIVDNMLSRYTLTGMTRDEVISMLGPDNGSDPHCIVYELGSADGWLPIDLERLDIQLENGIVTGYAVVRYG